MNYKLTLFQARYIQFHVLVGGSTRDTASWFFERYDIAEDGSFYCSGRIADCMTLGHIADGLFLRELAIEKLKENGITPYFDRWGAEINYGYQAYREWRKEMKMNPDKTTV